MEGFTITSPDRDSPLVSEMRLFALQALLITRIKENGNPLEDGNGWVARFDLRNGTKVAIQHLKEDDPDQGQRDSIYIRCSKRFFTWDDDCEVEVMPEDEGTYLEREVDYRLFDGDGFVSESFFRYDEDGDVMSWNSQNAPHDGVVLTQFEKDAWEEIEDDFHGYSWDFGEADVEELMKIIPLFTEFLVDDQLLFEEGPEPDYL